MYRRTKLLGQRGKKGCQTDYTHGITTAFERAVIAQS
jgi:hypothetical protein